MCFPINKDECIDDKCQVMYLAYISYRTTVNVAITFEKCQCRISYKFMMRYDINMCADTLSWQSATLPFVNKNAGHGKIYIYIYIFLHS